MCAGWLARGEPSLPAGDSWLSGQERLQAASMRFAKRHNEYLVARWTVKHAVAAWLGITADATALARIEARHAADGAPEIYVDGAPLGSEMSLTDRAGWAVCLVAPSGSGPGCDLELVEPRTPAFVGDFLTPYEQRLVTEAPDRDLAANLVWSAKESALKVLRTGLRRDTRSVEVSVGNFTAPERTWSPMSVRTSEGETFAGWWRRSGVFVLTTCARVPLEPPVSLEEPPALDAAQPLHSWLTQAAPD